MTGQRVSPVAPTAGRRSGRVGRLLTTLVLAASGLVGGVAAAVPAGADDGVRYCSTSSETAQPVLLVHGFNSSAKTWGEAGRRQLSQAGSNTCVAVFDYGYWSGNWVTDPHIGPALAREIDTLAAASKTGGGTGKVIVVAHSMGGLATRCAIAASCNGGISGVAGRVRELISFGTPNTGAWVEGSQAADDVHRTLFFLLSTSCDVAYYGLGPLCALVRNVGTGDAERAFKPRSDQLEALPVMPSSIPVYALAAHLELYSSFFGYWKVDDGDIGDGLVDEGSAQAEHHTIGGVGGAQTIDCGRIDVTDWLDSAHSCWHGTEPNDTRFLDAAAWQIHLVEKADTPQRPLDTVMVNTFGPGAYGSVYVTVWARDHTRDCLSRVYGDAMRRYVAAHYCQEIRRVLASATIAGRPVAIAQEYIDFGVPPGWSPTSDIPPSYGYAMRFDDLVRKNGTGGLQSLIADGARFPGSGNNIRYPNAFWADAQDGGAAMAEVWYLDGPTLDNDPSLMPLARSVFLQI